MAAEKLLKYYSYDDYKEWEDSWELIEGVPYAMAPAPYPKHQKVVFAVSKELDKNLKCTFKDICEVYISPVDWKVDEQSVVQPDVAIFCEKTDRQYFSKTPPLVVEVLSRSTARKDTTAKFDLYEKNGVLSYIMIDPKDEKVEIYELKDDKYVLAMSLEHHGRYAFSFDECSVAIDFGVVFS